MLVMFFKYPPIALARLSDDRLVHDVTDPRETFFSNIKYYFPLSSLSGEFECVRVNNVSEGTLWAVIV